MPLFTPRAFVIPVAPARETIRSVGLSKTCQAHRGHYYPEDVIAAVQAEKATLIDHHEVCQLHLRNVPRMGAGLAEPSVFVL